MALLKPFKIRATQENQQDIIDALNSHTIYRDWHWENSPDYELLEFNPFLYKIDYSPTKSFLLYRNISEEEFNALDCTEYELFDKDLIIKQTRFTEEFKIKIPNIFSSVKFQNMMFDNGIYWKFHQNKNEFLISNEHYLIVKHDMVLNRLVLVCADEDVWADYEVPEYKMTKDSMSLEEVS